MTSLNQEKLIENINSKNEEVKELNKKVIELKKDLTICLRNNDNYNLELRKLKLYNFFYKMLIIIYVLNYIYYYYFNSI